jgi:hypothetical protein
MLLSGVETFLIEHQRFMGFSTSQVKVAGIDPLMDVLSLHPVAARCPIQAFLWLEWGR